MFKEKEMSEFIDRLIERTSDKLAEKLAEWYIKKNPDINPNPYKPKNPVPNTPKYPYDVVVAYGCPIDSYSLLDQVSSTSIVSIEDITKN